MTCTHDSVTQKTVTKNIQFDTAYTGTYRIRISVAGTFTQPTDCRVWVDWRLIVAGQEYVPFSSTPSAAFFDITVSDAQFDSLGLQCTYNAVVLSDSGDTGDNVNIPSSKASVTGVIDGFSIGKLAQSSTVIVQDNKGNQLQEEANKIAQEGNKLQEESNKLQEEENKLQEESNKIQQGIFDKIADFFGSFFENIINALKSLFIPEDGYFEDFFSRLNDFFSEKLGALYTPIDIFVDIIQGVITAVNNNKIELFEFVFPGVEWNGVYIIQPSLISIQEMFGELPYLHDALYFISDVIMVGSVISLLQNKLKGVMKN